MRLGFLALTVASASCARAGFDVVDDLGELSDGVVTLSAVAVAFATPNTAFITWSPEGVVHGVALDGGWASFDRYEIWYGEDCAAVSARATPANVWGPSDDTNLATPDQASGPQIVSRTMITGLAPATDYCAQVRAVSDLGATLGEGRLVAFTTAATPTTSVDWFVDDFAPGSWVLVEAAGSSYQLTSASYSGTAAWEVTLPERPEGTVIHYGGLDIPLTPQDAPTFARTFLEVALSCDGGVSAYVEVSLLDLNGNALFFSYPDYVTCQPGFQLLQIPLSAMTDRDDAPAVPGTLDSSFEQFWLYGLWPAGAIHIDQIRVRF
jgi:hypothetical protein